MLMKFDSQTHYDAKGYHLNQMVKAAYEMGLYTGLRTAHNNTDLDFAEVGDLETDSSYSYGYYMTAVRQGEVKSK
ncbi:hypothetical protein PQ472_07925 [Lacticaseibacillus pabuli]|uniref:Nitroreductase family protein n=1 Tax=Lacticaseibacillus pabuli TaxID=3025672 RepID=A0ABY7WNS7_9LACO|nr:hypothetical protein [Lacticaseibacillus sp. KACC 23028]WDF81853.1 hypothetical protein PQ472_07925 [Lacticaseibacillus sp. KACC 23028]